MWAEEVFPQPSFSFCQQVLILPYQLILPYRNLFYLIYRATKEHADLRTKIRVLLFPKYYFFIETQKTAVQNN